MIHSQSESLSGFRALNRYISTVEKNTIHKEAAHLVFNKNIRAVAD